MNYFLQTFKTFDSPGTAHDMTKLLQKSHYEPNTGDTRSIYRSLDDLHSGHISAPLIGGDEVDRRSSIDERKQPSAACIN